MSNCSHVNSSEFGRLISESNPRAMLLIRWESFIYGSKPNVPDYMIRGKNTYRLISDERGSVRFVVDSNSGEIMSEINYNDFGRIVSDTSPGFQPFGFAGCLYDHVSQLCHFGSREYDPSTGRFISKDPTLFAGGDTNLYGYVLNDPINGIDPQGLFKMILGGLPLEFNKKTTAAAAAGGVVCGAVGGPLVGALGAIGAAGTAAIYQGAQGDLQNTLNQAINPPNAQAPSGTTGTNPGGKMP